MRYAIIFLIALSLSGCCTKQHYPPLVIMPPTQQEQKIMALQEQALRKQIEQLDREVGE